ncbi:A disintegrin and metalloproteinase with thrombospondin motifs 19 isoform X4 [Alligator sinensis]|uniref:A disintegrin and metalloproteinase with thrombospondin motifs 19 isoform X4 n=1 Tax=Alligator sinensis TaxID=38654 RepID=A0A3Q0HD19_ALLSI|nr:A disintegrin and metalloproteinase with thrombospondin motifs 19 isoform X4 [Alligator sinensis]
MEKKTGMRLSHVCCIFYQLCFLSSGIISGLHASGDSEEWEIVFPALWSRGQQEPAGGSGGGGSCSTDPNCGNKSSTSNAPTTTSPVAGSSREVRSVSSSVDRQPQPAGEAAEEEDTEDEYESQEFYHWSPLPQGSGAISQLPPPPSPPPPPPSEDGDEVLLRIPAFAREFYLLLKRDSRFLAPGFAVEERLRGEGKSPPGAAQSQPERACYYSGAVLHYPGSFASFSTCGGLIGFIQINEDFIFIEPLNRTLAVTGYAHRVYRRKRSIEEKVAENPVSHTHYCGVVAEKRKSKNQKVSENGRRKRYSYKLPQEYNIETVVVADPAMVLYHGTDAARRFILTILNMVFNLFQHKSLGVQVNLRVTKLVMLHETPADMYIGHHGEKMLESFCKWQHEEFGKKNDIHLEMSTSWGEDLSSVDAAILITRKDFCVHKDEPCDTVGIAYLSGMCSEKRKCIIAEDNGLNLAFTIAHEMGHNMGINHDNDHPSCADGLHIMSGEWIKGQNLGDVSWSRCSREDLERFLSMLFALGYGVRWKVRRNAKLNWIHQWMEQTVKLERPGPEGDCHGPRLQYKICENLSCPAGAPAFRDWQCQAFSVRSSYQKHILQWQAVIDDEKPCALFCSPGGKDQPILLTEKVMDGTSCGLQGLDICANGRCQKFGCDGILGSLAREDHCGVCNGNGKSCKVIKGDFNHTRGAGYVEALVIPAGARRIKVVEEKPAHSYLALRDASKQSINSDWKIEHSGTFNIAGTTVHYVRRGLWEKISAKGPTTSPLHLLVLLFHDQNYGLHYEYTIPLDPLPENQSSKVSEPLFMWTHSGWEDCDAMCGGGERKTTVSCTKIMNKNISLVDNKKCKYLTKPEPQIRKCNEQPCQTRWMMTEWTPCSRTCGKGTQNRQVACTQQLRNGTLIRARERDCLGPKPASAQRCEGQDCMTVWEAGVWSECSVKCGKGVRHRTVRCTNPRKKCVLSTRPKEAEDCEDYSKCYVWRMGDWSKEFLLLTEASWKQLKHYSTFLSCWPWEYVFSPKYISLAGNRKKESWCSVTCGKGMQSRVIQCMHKITGRHGNECFSSEKPAAYRPCHLQPCNEKINVNTITSPRLAALTFKCLGDQWPVYCRVIREKNLCQDMRWYQRCCETCRDFYAQKMQQKS